MDERRQWQTRSMVSLFSIHGLHQSFIVTLANIKLPYINTGFKKMVRRSPFSGMRSYAEIRHSQYPVTRVCKYKEKLMLFAHSAFADAV